MQQCCWEDQLQQDCQGAPAPARLLTRRALLLQVLEAVLPETPAEMLQLVLRHKRQGASGRFAACQLMAIAADCMVGAAPLLCIASSPRMNCSGACRSPGSSAEALHTLALQDYTDAAVRSSARVALQELVTIDPRWAEAAAGCPGWLLQLAKSR
jgi:hypothetical protein